MAHGTPIISYVMAREPELGVGGPHERDWRGIGTALLVIMAICTLIALAVLILTPVSTNADAFRAPMNLSDLVALRSPLVSLKWTDEHSIMYETLLNGVELFNINTLRSERLLDRETMVFFPNINFSSLSIDRLIIFQESAKTITMMSYDREHNYPMVSEIQYPKTGEKRLPTYAISIWDKTNKTLKQMDIQLRDSVAFHYLYGVSWVILKGKETFVAVWANRYQNHISITLCEHEIAMCNLVCYYSFYLRLSSLLIFKSHSNIFIFLVFEHKYPVKTWALPDDFQNILSSDDSIYILLPKTKSDGNSYQHIAKLSIQVRRPFLLLLNKIIFSLLVIFCLFLCFFLQNVHFIFIIYIKCS
uniref:DPPIV_N domain-containing protein n=1 Tax=Heterorhabditis bacteriophora TaxID=37862 RepID=A0A1I7WHM2_HETBA